eukprot:gene9955-7831_t
MLHDLTDLCGNPTLLLTEVPSGKEVAAKKVPAGEVAAAKRAVETELLQFSFRGNFQKTDRDNSVPAGEEAAAQKVLDAKFREFKSEYGAFEKGLNMVMSGVQEGLHPMCMVASDTSRLLSLLEALPHGLVETSNNVASIQPLSDTHTSHLVITSTLSVIVIQCLVETSNNVASVQPLADTDTTYLVVTSTRSSIGSALEAVRDRIGTIASLCGARVGRGPAYPGWQPNPDSALLQVTKKVYNVYLPQKRYCQDKAVTKKVYNQYLPQKRYCQDKAVHANSHCLNMQVTKKVYNQYLPQKRYCQDEAVTKKVYNQYLPQKRYCQDKAFPGMDMVSFGPTIREAHSPDERVLISTVKPFWELTLGILVELADRR